MGEKIQSVVEEIEKLTVLELNELVKALEDKFGVSSFVPQMVQAAAGAPAQETAPSNVNVILASCGDNKIQVIKALREINPQLGLKEAKDITDTLQREHQSAVNLLLATDEKLFAKSPKKLIKDKKKDLS